MKKKAVALILVFANILTLASCAKPSSRPGPFDDDDELSAPDEKIIDCANKLSRALADCDYGKFKEYCLKEPEEVKDVIPYIPDKEDPDADFHRKTDNTLLTKNMIASSIKYEVDENSVKEGFWGRKYSVDVTFSCKDYNKVLEQNPSLLSPAEFNTLLYEINDTIDKTFTLEFSKQGGEFLLINGDDLAEVYNFEGIENINYAGALFDMVEDMYMTGDGWDPVTESYYDTNSLEIVLKISEEGRNYTWSYKYRVSIETWPDWTHLYLSDVIVEEGPEEIRIKYTQEENFEPGFYVILFYSSYDSTIVGMEFDVFNSQFQETTDTVDTAENTDITGITDTEEITEPGESTGTTEADPEEN